MAVDIFDELITQSMIGGIDWDMNVYRDLCSHPEYSTAEEIKELAFKIDDEVEAIRKHVRKLQNVIDLYDKNDKHEMVKQYSRFLQEQHKINSSRENEVYRKSKVALGSCYGKTVNPGEEVNI